MSTWQCGVCGGYDEDESSHPSNMCRCKTVHGAKWSTAKIAWQAMREALVTSGTVERERLGVHFTAIDAIFFEGYETRALGPATVQGATFEDRSLHTCMRSYGWSLFCASKCEGCAIEYLRNGGDPTDLARACTGLDLPMSTHVDVGGIGINYMGAPTQDHLDRAKRLWIKLHGGT